MREDTKKFIPRHLGIIMDGNRRWAKKSGLPALLGHARGYDKVKKVGDWCLARGIKYLTVWAFSTENWNRSKQEVAYLMKLMKNALSRDVKQFHQKGIKVKIIGSRHGLTKDMIRVIIEAEELTKNNTAAQLNIAFNHGGRAEIIDGIIRMLKDRVSPKKVNEDLISSYFDSAGIPPLDFIIRTSGEQRLSGFMLWLSSYAELYFCRKMWPAFSESDLDDALEEFAQRNRRFGGN